MASADSDQATIDTQSWRDLLNWINRKLQYGGYTQVEELSSGCAYCEIIKSLLPPPVDAIKIKNPTYTKDDKRYNLKVLNNMLEILDARKPVPIENLLNGQFKDNFYYLQWFKKFYDSHEAAVNEMKLRAAKLKQSKLNEIPKKREGDKKELVATVAPTIANIGTKRREELIRSLHDHPQLTELFTNNFMKQENITRRYALDSEYAVYHITVKKSWDPEKKMVTVSSNTVKHNK